MFLNQIIFFIIINNCIIAHTILLNQFIYNLLGNNIFISNNIILYFYYL
jgi:hypothetical protein